MSTKKNKKNTYIFHKNTLSKNMFHDNFGVMVMSTLASLRNKTFFFQNVFMMKTAMIYWKDFYLTSLNVCKEIKVHRNLVASLLGKMILLNNCTAVVSAYFFDGIERKE